MNLPVYTLTQGRLPLLISIPHGGEHIPEHLAKNMTPAAKTIADTDWHLDRLYQFAVDMGASVLRSNYSRYVIDLNRAPDGSSLYPGQTTTGLCPLESFRGEPVYISKAAEPSEADIAERVKQYWMPYHQTLTSELARLKKEHGHVLLWEAHSIASVLPRLFEGQLPDLNIGTFNGAACDLVIRQAAESAAKESDFTSVVDGRFKGGYLTRHYGQPKDNIHAIQLEMAQYIYMSEAAPFAYDEEKAAILSPVLEKMVTQSLLALSQCK